MIFLLDFLAQVLNRHIFLREFNLDSAALVLQFRQPAALRTQILVARSDFRFLRIFLREQSGGLRVHLLAFVLQFFNLPARFHDFRFRQFLARNERRTFAFALPDDLGQFLNPLRERLLLLAERSCQLFIRRERDFTFGQRGVRNVALLPQTFQFSRERNDLFLRAALGRFKFVQLRRQRVPFLQTFLFLRREALDFKNDRVNFLVQQPV